MAIHTELPIYKLAYELLMLATNLTKNMPRDFKASIGGTIRKDCIDIMILIFRANCAMDKTQYLDRLIEKVQVAELMFRVSKDARLISVKQYAAAIEITGKVGKQAGGWRKYAASSPAASRSRP